MNPVPAEQETADGDRNGGSLPHSLLPLPRAQASLAPFIVKCSNDDTILALELMV